MYVAPFKGGGTGVKNNTFILLYRSKQMLSSEHHLILLIGAC